jgi:predicted ferric reductase
MTRAGWILTYLAIALAPLGLALIDLDPGRGFVINLSVALGFVGLSMMGLQFVLVARFKRVAAPFGIDVLLRFHREIAYVALVLILAHPILLFVDRSKFVDLLDVPDAPWRARMAVLSTASLLALVALSVWRRQLRMRYETWQLTHDVLAIVVVAAALVHAELVHYYLDEVWEQVLWAAMSAALVSLVVWVRVVKPIQRYRHPWKVEEVVPEHGHAFSVNLVPARADGPSRFRFEAGQFTWVMVGGSPFALTQHPFSVSSSAERSDRVTVTIKELGDFTKHVAELEPGTTVYLDGPHGSFCCDRHPAPGYVLIGGGVGVTPLMSMLRTHADRGVKTPTWLFLAGHDEQSIIFAEEVERLCDHCVLEVVYVVDEAGREWTGERGHLDAAILRRHLPEHHGALEYFICGPPGMMDAAERALEEIGVPAGNVHSERFVMA